jgi:hypothetical protein
MMFCEMNNQLNVSSGFYYPSQTSLLFFIPQLSKSLTEDVCRWFMLFKGTLSSMDAKVLNEWRG